jgi:hypothetical protein
MKPAMTLKLLTINAAGIAFKNVILNGFALDKTV